MGAVGELTALWALEITCLLWEINNREHGELGLIKMRPDMSQICDIDISAVTSCQLKSKATHNCWSPHHYCISLHA